MVPPANIARRILDFQNIDPLRPNRPRARLQEISDSPYDRFIPRALRGSRSFLLRSGRDHGCKLIQSDRCGVGNQ